MRSKQKEKNRKKQPLKCLSKLFAFPKYLRCGRCCFSHCGQGEGYCFTGGRLRLQNKRGVSAHPHSLPPCPAFALVCGRRSRRRLQWLAGLERMRGWSVRRRLLWSEVHHCHSPSASLRPGRGPYPPLPALSCMVQECLRTQEHAKCQIIVCVFFIPFRTMDLTNLPSMRWSLFNSLSLFLARRCFCDATWPRRQSANLITLALRFPPNRVNILFTVTKVWSCNFTRLACFHTFCWQNIPKRRLLLH